MATYADWAASKGESKSSTQPVKLIIDGQGNVLEQGTVAAAVSSEPHASRDHIVQEVRRQCRAGFTAPLQHGALFRLAAGLGDPGQLPASTIVLVLDTTWLLSHAVLLKALAGLIPKTAATVAPILLIVPGVVLSEVEALASSVPGGVPLPGDHASVASVPILAQRATNFLQESLISRPDLVRAELTAFGVPGQAMIPADTQLVQCCQSFQQKGLQVGLLSNDGTLCSQATAAELPYMNYSPEYDVPEAFLTRLHPDLPVYFNKQRASMASASTAATAEPTQSLESSGNGEQESGLPSHMEERLLEQQRAAIAHLEHNFPVLPPELLEILSVVTTTLLAPAIYPALLQHMANGSQEIFAYMLSRSSILRDLQLSQDKDAVDCTRWQATTCLRLLDQNWQMCFASQAANFGSRSSSSSWEKASKPTFSFANSNSSNRAAGIGTTSNTTSGSSLSQSRWASSTTGTNSPNRKVSSGYSSGANSARAAASQSAFHPSKLPALARSLASSAEDVLRWTPARWRLVLEDLELVLCGTALLDNQHNAKQKAELLLQAARKNVDAWRS